MVHGVLVDVTYSIEVDVKSVLLAFYCLFFKFMRTAMSVFF